MEEDLISKLRDFSKLSFQRKVEVLKAGRPIPELRELHQLTRQKDFSKRLVHKKRMALWLSSEKPSFLFSLSFVFNS